MWIWSNALMRYDKLLIVATRAARPARKASARNARFETRFAVRGSKRTGIAARFGTMLARLHRKILKKSECNKYKSCTDKEL